MIADPSITSKHLESVKFMVSGAAPIGATDVQRFYDKFGIPDTKLKFLQGKTQRNEKEWPTFVK